MNIICLCSRTYATIMTPAKVVCVLASVYMIALLIARNIAVNDPGSWFFDPKTAYKARYTKIRQIQAESFVDIANVSTFWRPDRDRLETRTVRMCIGILSVARDPRYLDATVGSLLDGLTTDERDELHVIALLPYFDPTKHSAYREPWLHNLVDEIVRQRSLAISSRWRTRKHRFARRGCMTMAFWSAHASIRRMRLISQPSKMTSSRHRTGTTKLLPA